MKKHNSQTYYVNTIVMILFFLGLSAVFFIADKLDDQPQKITGKYTVWIGSINNRKAYQSDSWYRSDGLIIFTNKETGHKMTATTCNVPFVENNYFEPPVGATSERSHVEE